MTRGHRHVHLPVTPVQLSEHRAAAGRAPARPRGGGRGDGNPAATPKSCRLVQWRQPEVSCAGQKMLFVQARSPLAGASVFRLVERMFLKLRVRLTIISAQPGAPRVSRRGSDRPTRAARVMFRWRVCYIGSLHDMMSDVTNLRPHSTDVDCDVSGVAAYDRTS